MPLKNLLMLCVGPVGREIRLASLVPELIKAAQGRGIWRAKVRLHRQRALPGRWVAQAFELSDGGVI